MTDAEKERMADERIEMHLTGTDGHLFRGRPTREQAVKIVQFFSECEQMIDNSKQVCDYEI